MKTPFPSPSVFHAACARSIGYGHVDSGLPCQDACGADVDIRAHLVVCDGRGSARLSDQGAERAVESVRKSMCALGPLFELALDRELDSNEAAKRWELVARVLVCTMAAEQIELARASGEPAKEYEFTAALAVVGKQHIGWLQVGDSQLVSVRHGIAAVVHVPESLEFAKQTRFIRANKDPGRGLACGVMPTSGTDAHFTFSDGVSTRTLTANRSHPTGIFRQLTQLVSSRPSALGETIDDMLGLADWRECTRDDLSLAALVMTSKSAPFDESLPIPPAGDASTPEEPASPEICPSAIAAIPLALARPAPSYPADWERHLWWFCLGCSMASGIAFLFARS